MNAPLEDLRVIAIEQYGAGPFGTMQLADLGADVIKIEDPTVGGDVSRYVPPYQHGSDSLFFESFNRGKRSVLLDLRRPDGREVLERLVATADALVSNLRGDLPDSLGLRYADLQHVNAKLVCCSLSGYGMTGPRRAQGAYDYVLQGLAGWQSITGEPGGLPTKSGLSLADYCGGYVLAIAVLSGVWRARREGVGADIDLSLFEVALAQLTYIGTWVASQGYIPKRQARSAHQSIVPFQNFETANGWIIIACPKQSLWRRLCEAIGLPDLPDDARFESFATRDEHRDTLLPILEERLRSRTSAEWLEILSAHGVPAGPVNDIATAFDDAQALARGATQESMHPVLGPIRQPASPFRFGDFTPQASLAPMLGGDTEAVLREVGGYSAEAISELHEQGTVISRSSEAPSGQ